MSLPEFSEFTRLLRDAGALSDPAESHGTLVGMLAADPGEDCCQRWIALTLHGTDQPEGNGRAVPAELRPRLDSVYAATERSLADLQMGFEPLLPEDEADLRTQAEAMGSWCQGFLYGFTLIRRGGGKALPPQVQEVLEDLQRMAEVETPDASGDEQDHEALVELVEYIRVAAQLVHDELRLAASDADNDATH